MRRINLWWVGAALFLISGVLLGILVFEGKLGWAWNALDLHLDGTTTTPPERIFEGEARILLQRGGDSATIRKLLDASIGIDEAGSRGSAASNVLSSPCPCLV